MISVKVWLVQNAFTNAKLRLVTNRDLRIGNKSRPKTFQPTTANRSKEEGVKRGAFGSNWFGLASEVTSHWNLVKKFEFVAFTTRRTLSCRQCLPDIQVRKSAYDSSPKELGWLGFDIRSNEIHREIESKIYLVCEGIKRCGWAHSVNQKQRNLVRCLSRPCSLKKFFR